MIGSSERINFIADYTSSYETKIRALNSNGLFDSAKMFELFAQEVCALYFKQKFTNLNSRAINYPYVDLVSEDGKTYCQVSTCADLPAKIKDTLIKIRDTNDGKLKEIRNLYFFVLNNGSVSNVKDFTGDNRIGDIDFRKDENLITTKTIINKAENNLDFQNSLYELLKKESDFLGSDIEKFKAAVEDSKNVYLNDIRDAIGDGYHIDLKKQIEEIDAEKHPFIFVTGPAGSGKSVLCKKALESKRNVLFVRAEKLASISNVNDIWNFDLKKIFPIVEGNLFIYIDALEFISDSPTKMDALKVFFSRAHDFAHIHIIASCRTSELSAFSTLIGEYSVFNYEIHPISSSQLIEIRTHFPSLNAIVKNSSYRDLLHNPFYLDALLKAPDLGSIKNVADLRNYLWKNVICLKNSDYEKIITDIALERATKFELWSNSSNYDASAISILVRENVFMRDAETDGIRLKYDIFEDICFEQYIDKKFDSAKGNYASFFETLSNLGRCAYRRYQIWVENKLFAKENREKFLYSLVTNNLSPKWKKQTEIGIVKSNYCADFFDEYGDRLIDQNILLEFITLTNLYGFSIAFSEFPLNMILKGIGHGRESIIKIIAANLSLCDDVRYKKPIDKLLTDYSNCANAGDAVGEDACKVLLYLLKRYERKSQDGEVFYDYSEIKGYVEALYRLNEHCDAWIKEFLNLPKKDLKSQHSDVRRFSEDAIEDIVYLNGIPLAKKYNVQIYSLLHAFYFEKIRDDTSSLYYGSYSPFDSCSKYGLNEHAENYGHKTRGKTIETLIFYSLFKFHFSETLNWIVELTNEIANTIKKNGDARYYEIYLSDSNAKRSFLGIPEMWGAGEIDNIVPTILGDLLYCAKRVAFERFSENKDKQFASKVKETILSRANNIFCLSILSNLGLRAGEELPGYSLDLISNLDLVLEDIDRIVRVGPIQTNSTKNNDNIGLQKYADIFPRIDLREYARECQLYDQSVKEKCHEVFDYLYSITENNKTEAVRYLQIQIMDLRNAKAYKLSNGGYALVPSVSGEAEKLTKSQEKENEEFARLLSKAGKLQGDIDNGQFDSDQADCCIKELLKKTEALQPLLISKQFVSLISSALLSREITAEKRDEYCNLWLDFIQENALLHNEADKKLPVLFVQIRQDISLKTKIRIKKYILEKLIPTKMNEPNGYRILLYIKKFLKQNKDIANAFLTTILLLAKDEMQHQLFNYAYLREHRTDEDFTFKPNMQPRLLGVDRYIEVDGNTPYSSKKEQIVNRYLFNEENYDFSDFNIDDYDLKFVSVAFNLGFDLGNPLLEIISSQYVDLYVKLQTTKGVKNVRDIVGWQELNCAASFLQENLLSKDNTDKVLGILFKNKDFSIFNDSLIEFYNQVLNSLTAFYFHSYDNKNNRKLVETIVRKMEECINQISIVGVKQKLSSALILGFSIYGGRSDWSRFKTDYSYSDKMFLNKMFAKYGCFNLNEMISVIWHLQYKKLLPEILPSLWVSLKKYFEEKDKIIIDANLNKNTKSVIDEVMFYSFANFEKKIKCDSELTESFEGVLELLIEQYQNSEAAVLLDKFRIH